MHEITPEYEISAMMPLSSVANFHSTAARIGSCSEAFSSAMTSLFDAFPAETPFSNNDDLLPKVNKSAELVSAFEIVLLDDAGSCIGGTL